MAITTPPHPPTLPRPVPHAACRILLTTINARYAHCSLGLRYLYANLEELQADARIQEFTLRQSVETIVAQLLAEAPRIIGIGVYIWNVALCSAVAREIKRRAPDVILIAGGPEISYETETSPMIETVDYVITGEAEHAFAHLCRQLLETPQTLVRHAPPALNPHTQVTARHAPQTLVRHAPQVLAHHAPQVLAAGERASLDFVHLPYEYYTDADIAHRVIYVESTRGCPFRCEFCLSSLSGRVRFFPEEPFFAAMERLLARGARRFKFIDRTFNVSDTHALTLLDFFAARWQPGMQLHFEIVPDRISASLLERFLTFPPGGLHLEAGIQTFNPAVLALISRTQNKERALTNLRRLIDTGRAEVHADLIMGLPGQTSEDIANDFRQLFALGPHEIQVGVLKRLRGTPILRHTEPYQLNFSLSAPYEIVSTSSLHAETLSTLKRFAKFAEAICNHNRFPQTVALIRASDCDPFALLNDFATKAWERFGRSHSIPLPELAETLFAALSDARQPPWPDTLRNAIESDFYRVPGRREALHLPRNIDSTLP